jgi:hypothetical protein
MILYCLCNFVGLFLTRARFVLRNLFFACRYFTYRTTGERGFISKYQFKVQTLEYFPSKNRTKIMAKLLDACDMALALLELLDLKIQKGHESCPVEALREYKLQIEAAVHTLKSINAFQRSSNPQEKQEKQQRIADATQNLRNLVHQIEESLHVKVEEFLKHEQKSTHVSEKLYLSDIPGALSHRRVSHVPSFPVRGRHYLADGNKKQSHGSLFYLRGIQMLEFGEFQTHIALKKWCGFPKFPQDNEWLILNFMVLSLFAFTTFFSRF